MVSLVAPLVLNLVLVLCGAAAPALNLVLVLCGAAALVLNLNLVLVLNLRRAASPHPQRTIVKSPWKFFPSERLST